MYSEVRYRRARHGNEDRRTVCCVCVGGKHRRPTTVDRPSCALLFLRSEMLLTRVANDAEAVAGRVDISGAHCRRLQFARRRPRVACSGSRGGFFLWPDKHEEETIWTEADAAYGAPNKCLAQVVQWK
jgi:hypothetical protein